MKRELNLKGVYKAFHCLEMMNPDGFVIVAGHNFNDVDCYAVRGA